MILQPFRTDESAAEWDQLVKESVNGTFLHSRKFLSHHRDRFMDRSVIIRNKSGTMLGVLPAAQDKDDETSITSHPGITYGGLVHDGSLRGNAMLDALRDISEHYRQLGYRRLCYKPVPYAYHRVPSADDLYALARLGARRWRCDLSTILDLQQRACPSHGRRSSLKKAAASGIQVSEGPNELPAFWSLLEETLARRHGAHPTHSLEEMRELIARFPDAIRLQTASSDGRLIAGQLLFETGPVLHAQYFATSELGRNLSALDLVIEKSIVAATSAGFRYYDFGISNEADGRILNSSLFAYKASFGAGTMVHEHYELTLEKST